LLFSLLWFSLHKLFVLIFKFFCLFEMASKYFSYGNIADHAVSQGYKVSGDIGGASVGKHAYTLGAITSAFMSKLLMDKLSITASPIPVGFNGETSSRHVGAVAKQFLHKINGDWTAEHADRHVIEAYFTDERPAAPEGYEVPVFDVPAVHYADIIETRRKGRTRTDVLKVGDLPEKFYVRIAGDEDDIETMEAICGEDGIAFVRTADNCYITNVDLSGFPPLPEYLMPVQWEKNVSISDSEKAVGDESVPAPPQQGVPPAGDGIGSGSAPTKEPTEIPLPDEWQHFMENRDVNSYNALNSCPGFARSVRTNTRSIGSNKHGWTKKVINQWEENACKTVPEYVEIIMSQSGRNEAMAAKLLRALSTHLRVEGDMLKRGLLLVVGVHDVRHVPRVPVLFLGLPLILLDGPVVDIPGEEEDLSAQGRLSCVDVANEDDVHVLLLLTERFELLQELLLRLRFDLGRLLGHVPGLCGLR